MKKKLISLVGAILFASAPVALASEYYTTWCGKVALVPDKEALENQEENVDEFYDDIDIALCGSVKP